MKTARCVFCKHLKPKQLVKRRGGISIYVDNRNRRWVEKVCPDCRVLAGYQAPREDGKRDKDLGPAGPLYPPKMRACRGCGVGTVNYFKCISCAGFESGKYEADDEFITNFDSSGDYQFHLAPYQARGPKAGWSY